MLTAGLLIDTKTRESDNISAADQSQTVTARRTSKRCGLNSLLSRIRRRDFERSQAPTAHCREDMFYVLKTKERILNFIGV